MALQTLESVGGRKILNLLDLGEVCDEEGTWTLRVRSGRGLSVRTLGEISFEVTREERANHARQSVEVGAPGKPRL